MSWFYGIMEDSMLADFWFTFLYQPLFNALIWIYLNLADRNLGWAVVLLTVFLRIVLLPLTVISERDALRQQKVNEEAEKAARAFKGDPVAQREELRKIMKRNSISPWAKVVTLAIQFVVLVLLYQVFVRGITGERVIKILYPWIDFPGKMNTMFYGFDIGASHQTIWAGIVAVYLFASIFFHSRHERTAHPSQATFLFLFPLFTFFILWYLPMVKSLFILTSMLFSDTISLLRKIFFPVKVEAKH